MNAAAKGQRRFMDICRTLLILLIYWKSVILIESEDPGGALSGDSDRIAL
jgi:hypothetical protein